MKDIGCGFRWSKTELLLQNYCKKSWVADEKPWRQSDWKLQWKLKVSVHLKKKMNELEQFSMEE